LGNPEYNPEIIKSISFEPADDGEITFKHTILQVNNIAKIKIKKINP